MAAKKSLGQHWLDDQLTLHAICEIAEVKPKDIILEVGPGHGSLTRILLASGAIVTAIELDQELSEKLAARKTENLKVINQDILEFNLTTLPKNYKVVANIPYYLTSNLIRTLSESKNPPASMTLLVQKEVAERICAKPGKMSILSVSAQIYYDCTLGSVVTADKFTPPPKVDSQVVHMARTSQPLVGKDNKDFFVVVKAGFSNRRKTLENSLSAGLHIDKSTAEKLLADSGIKLSVRAQELSLGNWLSLSQNYRSIQPAQLG